MRNISDVFLSCWRKQQKNSQMPARTDSADDDDPLVFELPPNCKIPRDTVPGGAKHTELMEFLGKIKAETGFLEPLLIKLLVAGDFNSIRTSDLALARGSLKERDEETSEDKSRADFKTTGTGSKSNPRYGSCEGKLPREPEFRDCYDPNKPIESLGYDLKDNNYRGIFKPGSEIGISADLLQEYNSTISPNIVEVRKYKGLIYFAENVPQTENGRSNFDKMKPKHYAQEAERIGSILNHLQQGLYTEPQIISENGQVYFQFIDDKATNNLCRANLSELILPPYVEADPVLKQAALEFIKEINEKRINTVDGLTRYIADHHDVSTALQACHAPLFAVNINNGAVVPVMLQAGKSGEAIIRDADFAHFHKHPLTPILANKTFNGSSTDSIENFTLALKLLQIRLQSSSRESFARNLNEYVSQLTTDFTVFKIEYAALVELGMQGLAEALPENDLKGIVSIDISELTPEQKSAIILAKYNDFSSLSNVDPYLNYNKIDYFKKYAEDLEKTIKYHDENSDDLKMAGESSAHSLVMLQTLDNPMVVHGDESDHPRVKPEKFARITTHCNGKFIVTKNEEQYLKLLFSNPEIIKGQRIGVHPYWLRTKDLDDNGLLTGEPRDKIANAMRDLLGVQALQQGLLMANEIKGLDPMQGYDMYVKATIANMSRSMVKNQGERDYIIEIKKSLAIYFAELRQQVADTPKNKSAAKLQSKIDAIYANSEYNRRGRPGSKYDAYTPKQAANRSRRCF